MKINEFCEAYKAKKFMNTQQGMGDKFEWIRSQLEIKPYIPFREKRKIAEMIVAQNIKEVDGIKKYNSIDGYVSLIIASIAAHTNLEFGGDPVADYDLLAENNVLMDVLAGFESSHAEIDLLLHMTLDMEMEDNETSAMVGRFLNKISGMLDGVLDAVKDKFEDFDLNDVLGSNFNEEDLAKLSGLLNKLS